MSKNLWHPLRRFSEGNNVPSAIKLKVTKNHFICIQCGQIHIPNMNYFPHAVHRCTGGSLMYSCTQVYINCKLTRWHSMRLLQFINSKVRSMCSWTLLCVSSPVPSVLHLSHGVQCSPTLKLQCYEGRLPLTSWWRKSSNMTVGQCSLIYLAHHCYDWHPGSRCG